MDLTRVETSGNEASKMINQLPGWLFAAVFVLSMSLLASRATAADAASEDMGELWETTSQMSMEGMPVQMPARTQKVCAAKDRTEPPGATEGQPGCTNSNMKTVGSKVTWDVRCSGPDMTGVGEIVYSGTDAYSGSIRFTAEQGPMTVKLSGRKVGGCDDPK